MKRSYIGVSLIVRITEMAVSRVEMLPEYGKNTHYIIIFPLTGPQNEEQD